ncbi:MAG: bifunctional hydroxymethylpyrimidine kinase/phosphomethylpyrimidine kinase [Erysipelotrichales bacterium]|nr:bifunctional hydroxymethylpyrimidine kinase/phosphomethylpyrimidine kinase [Erysipelotrichales bacterium]
MRQKRCMAINDISGIGRCALGAMLPIIAMFDIECINIPTAVLSSSTAYKDFVMMDMSDYVGKYLEQYEKLQLHFDGCFIGFLGNAKVIHTLEDYILRSRPDFLFIDPIMGDNGLLYATYTNELVDGVRNLCQYADVITPNLTEFCALSEIEYDENMSDETIIKYCEKLGIKQIVVSGLERNNQIGNLIYDNGKVSYYYRDKVTQNRSGTGDVFSAVIYGALLRDKSLYDAVVLASDFVYEAVLRSDKLVEDKEEGLAFEGLLGMLWSRIWQEN